MSDSGCCVPAPSYRTVCAPSGNGEVRPGTHSFRHTSRRVRWLCWIADCPRRPPVEPWPHPLFRPATWCCPTFPAFAGPRGRAAQTRRRVDSRTVVQANGSRSLRLALQRGTGHTCQWADHARFQNPAGLTGPCGLPACHPSLHGSGLQWPHIIEAAGTGWKWRWAGLPRPPQPCCRCCESNCSGAGQSDSAVASHPGGPGTTPVDSATRDSGESPVAGRDRETSRRQVCRQCSEPVASRADTRWQSPRQRRTGVRAITPRWSFQELPATATCVPNTMGGGTMGGGTRSDPFRLRKLQPAC